MNKLVLSTILLFATSCSTNAAKEGLRVAATPVPHAQLLEFIKPELQAQGIELTILITEDYNMPNRALTEGEIDANFFQHIPFLDEQIKQFNYPIASLASIELEPMGLYSKKIRTLSELKERATIALPNDPTNEARALLLLQDAGLIKLDKPNNLQATILNIQDNPKQLQFLEIDAAMLPRSLQDVDLAAINTNYALTADLSPLKDALLLEPKDSPYANIIAIHIGEEERPDIQALKAVMTSEKMKAHILETYKGAILPAF